ncbi:nitroreductase family protein [Shewanella inventionis]|uniref:Oxidoreductase n=2 Tax=Shewanella TaxID=22 RepID=A0ABQ1J0Y0_9GAMM|nr:MULTISPECIES: nitroreductase family protein [Shewanella]MCL1158981.1 nitroreductase family protein [Shewanella inventionis]MCT8985414.1 nitroreductase family protein [Shewanella sp. KJ10-1]UAL43049.1 nitroreductase family protein [Shewanella inventionis]GGB57037.1 oxidoreductase [Shewanella inventionis]
MTAHLPLTDFIEYPQDEMLKRAQDNYLQVKRRHSIRSFSDRAVPQAIIEQCILAAGTAPNGANHQPWHFVAINSPEIKAQIRQQAEALEQAFYAGRAGEEWLDALKPLGTDANKPYLEHAPWLIAVFSKKRSEEEGEQKTNYYVHESVGIATGFLIQALHHAGLGTLTHTPKPMSFLSKVCGRDNDNERPYMLIIAGYPAEDATIPQHAVDKKSLAEICDFI